jgi:GTP-binding protein EngB required for normal cell division
MSNYHESLQNELNGLKQRVHRPNVLILGKTGGGKSTLANRVFGENTFATGTGRPVTKGISFFDSVEKGIGIFDSQGYEFGEAAETAFFQEVVEFASTSAMQLSATGVHLCWYCIPAEQERIHPIDLKTIGYLRSRGLPTAVILTKSDLLSVESVARLARHIQSQLPPNTPVFKASTLKVADAADVSEICEWSQRSLPESLQSAFIRAQRVRLENKRKAAVQVVERTTQLVAAAGLDAYDSSTTQKVISSCLSMTAEILYLYEMDAIESYLKGMAGIIEGSNKLARFLTALLEPVFELAGHILGGHPGRYAGKVLGSILAGLGLSKASQQLVTAVGMSVIHTCQSLCESALNGAPPSQADAQDLQREFEDGVRQRLEN